MNWRKPVGIGLMTISLVLLGGGWYVFAESQATATRTQQAWDRADRQCLEALRGVGEVRETGAVALVIMTIDNGRDWQGAVSDASGVIGYCNTRRLTRLCMGRGCEMSASLPAEGAILPDEKLAEVQRAPLHLEFNLRQVRP